LTLNFVDILELLGVLMIKKWNKIQLGLMLVALPFAATAAASAHQWISANSPIEAPAAVVEASQANAQRIHNITLNRAGGIEGRITSLKNGEGEGLSDLKVYFVRNGEIAKQTTTDASGTFQIDSVTEGAYSFVATGESGFAAYGVNVVAHSGQGMINTMEAAAVSPNFSVVQDILKNNLPEQIATEIVNGASNNTEKLAGGNRIQLHDGTLNGNIVPLFGDIANVEGTYVHIIQNDKQVARVQADAAGSFSVADLEAGVYDFVAAGPTGIAAVSFQAIDEEGEISAESVMDSDEIPVAIEPAAAAALPFQEVISADIPTDAAPSLDVCTTCSNDAGFVGQQVSYAGSEVVYDQGYQQTGIQYASEAVSNGGACGASCGSAGDFSGFSSCNSCGGAGGAAGGRLFGGGRLGAGGAGLRRLALLGGIAGAVVAIAADDDATDASPITTN
jgi:hypothetical protein